MRTTDDKTFVRRVLLIATPLFLLLLFLVLAAARRAPEYLERFAKSAAENGRFARAEAYIELISDTEAQKSALDHCRYLEAKSKQESGEYEAADSIFSNLGGYLDAAACAEDCRYAQAEAFYQSGSYAEAESLLLSIPAYAGAQSLRNACRYGMAESALADGDLTDAVHSFYVLGSYADAYDRAREVAAQITGENSDAALMLVLGYSEEDLLRQYELTEFRSALPRGRIAVGFYHSVILANDGRVFACGDNSRGQCEVSDWKNVEMLAAGGYHTLALCTDGTVRACGDNSCGQCDVSTWTDVVLIAAGDYDSYALTGDGRILHAGFAADALSSVTNAGIVSAGAYAAAALCADGSVASTHPCATDASFYGAADIAVSTASAITLYTDGTIATNSILAPQWTDVAAVFASATAYYGLTPDGDVLSAFFRSSDDFMPDDIADAVFIAAGATHTLVLFADGHIEAYGDNSFGQCAIDGLTD